MAENVRMRDLFNPLNTRPIENHREKTPDANNPYDDEAWGSAWGTDRQAAAQAYDARLYAQDEEMRKARRRARANLKAKQAQISGNPRGPYEWPREAQGGTRYHVNNEGKALPCKASVKACPYGDEAHFNMPSEYVAIEAQQVGDWILERRNDTRPLKYATEDLGSEDLRRLASQFSRAEADPNSLQVSLSISVGNVSPPVTISRRVGNLLDNRWKDHSYWTIDDGHEGHHFLGDRVSESDLRTFIGKYMGLYDFSRDEEVSRELSEELYSRIRTAMEATEAEAALVGEKSVHHSPVPLALPSSFERDEKGRWIGVANYATSAFRPRHLRTLDTRYLDVPTPQPVTFGPGFEVYDNDGGQGRASWSAMKTEEGWSITVQGTRGDLESFTATDPEDAARRFRQAYSKRVLSRSQDRARFFQDLNSEESKRELMIADRVSFIRELVEEDQRGSRLISESAADVQREAERAAQRRAEEPVLPAPQKKTRTGLFRR